MSIDEDNRRLSKTKVSSASSKFVRIHIFLFVKRFLGVGESRLERLGRFERAERELLEKEIERIGLKTA